MNSRVQRFQPVVFAVLFLVQGCMGTPTEPAQVQIPSLERVRAVELTELLPFDAYSSSARGVNSKGQVVGMYAVLGRSTQRGFLWDNGALTDLGTFVPQAINDQGQMVGVNQVDFQSYLWDHGTLTQIPCRGRRINVRGHVAGTWFTPSGHFHGCLWSEGRLIDIPGLTPVANDYGADFVSVQGLNDQDQIVGFSGIGGYFYPNRAFLWNRGTLTPLGTAAPGNAGEAVATDISGNGRIVGDATSAQFLFSPFLWRERTMATIGGLPGLLDATAVSDRGDVAGLCNDSDVSALPTQPSYLCVWHEGSTTALVGPGSGRVFGYISDMAADGKFVVGEFSAPGGFQHAAVWHR